MSIKRLNLFTEKFKLIYSSAMVRVLKTLSELERRLLLSNRKRIKKMSSPEFNNCNFSIVDVSTDSENIELYNPNLKSMEGHYFEPRNLILIPDATCELKTGLIVDSSNRIVSQSSPWPDDYLVLSRQAILRASHLDSLHVEDGESTSVLPSSSFYHWLIEALPGFLLVREKFPNIKIACQKWLPKYVEDFIQLFGLEVRRIPEVVKIKNLVISTSTKSSGWSNPLDIVRLRNNFSLFYDSNEPTKNKKIYISRVYSSRSPSFELNLQEYLKSCGWNIMIAEQLSLAEQIRAVSSAEVLMGVHGAGLSHALWMKPNTKLVEIRFPASPNCFVRLAKAADISYEPLLLSPQDMHSSAIPNILAESDLVKLGGLNQ